MIMIQTYGEIAMLPGASIKRERVHNKKAALNCFRAAFKF